MAPFHPIFSPNLSLSTPKMTPLCPTPKWSPCAPRLPPPCPQIPLFCPQNHSVFPLPPQSKLASMSNDFKSVLEVRTEVSAPPQNGDTPKMGPPSTPKWDFPPPSGPPHSYGISPHKIGTPPTPKMSPPLSYGILSTPKMGSLPPKIALPGPQMAPPPPQNWDLHLYGTPPHHPENRIFLPQKCIPPPQNLKQQRSRREHFSRAPPAPPHLGECAPKSAFLAPKLSLFAPELTVVGRGDVWGKGDLWGEEDLWG